MRRSWSYALPLLGSHVLSGLVIVLAHTLCGNALPETQLRVCMLLAAAVPVEERLDIIMEHVNRAPSCGGGGRGSGIQRRTSRL